MYLNGINEQTVCLVRRRGKWGKRIRKVGKVAVGVGVGVAAGYLGAKYGSKIYDQVKKIRQKKPGDLERGVFGPGGAKRYYSPKARMIRIKKSPFKGEGLDALLKRLKRLR